ncbi:hypothetical protein KZ483_02120 [Paenibacillus sp. sptzw28]|uniref:hypothetical protein n=1 Tax=Paenibacillus sp. sptzw28 TaxID=715179 RepID=UPI001C6EB3A4|nr:hypothetical protein [Paenibacillus sp. sptzw28]QYR21861.1 hypothetical protein KZ483_02120 [Paenibacillus sp. sptzw28]
MEIANAGLKLPANAHAADAIGHRRRIAVYITFTMFCFFWMAFLDIAEWIFWIFDSGKMKNGRTARAGTLRESTMAGSQYLAPAYERAKFSCGRYFSDGLN